MITKPMEGESIKDPNAHQGEPSHLGDLDPKSVEMRISGFGVVPAKYDPPARRSNSR